MTAGSTDQFAQDADRRMALAGEWDDLVEQVRSLPGFEDFLRPPRLENLLPAAAGGPVVVLNVSQWRCDALVVRRHGVEVIELPEITQEIVSERVRNYLAAVSSQQADTSPRDVDAARQADGVEARLHDCLRWMWDSFVRRILERLGYTNPPAPGEPWPRVWWCPTGSLTMLPIHAAGDYRTLGTSALDRVISSYTPTVRALLEARAARVETDASGRMLLVGMPHTPGQAALPNVKAEKELVEHRFAGRLTSLIGPAATRERVLTELPNHRWVHFACHGEQHLGDPSQGGMIVQDGVLTVNDLSSRRYQGEFAYLSGCKTAVGGVNLPDEAITLAAALHYTGYRHVIATLWSVRDAEAAQVAADVYEGLTQYGVPHADDAAAALHRAVLRLRERHRDRPSVWMPFAHTGP